MKGYRFFSERELSCHCGCGKGEMDGEFMKSLVLMRTEACFPFPLSSAFRCDKYDSAIGGAGVHTLGEAVDILVYGYRAYRLLRLAIKYGFTGIGISQKSKDRKERFIHIDTVAALPKRPRPWIWTY